MFAHRYFAARYAAPRYYPPALAGGDPEPPVVVATTAKGRRIVRWLMLAPSIENPIGEWIREREDEEILVL